MKEFTPAREGWEGRQHYHDPAASCAPTVTPPWAPRASQAPAQCKADASHSPRAFFYFLLYPVKLMIPMTS